MTPFLLLLVASVALLVGPFCSVIGEWSRPIRELIDGFALVAIAGICLLVVLPHVIADVGLIALALAAAGALLPILAHRLGSGSLVLIAATLVVHVLLDGAILSMQGESAFLAWAVVVHRLPAGYAVAIAVQASGRPVRIAWAIALAMVLATVAGYLAGPSLIASLPHEGVAGLEAFVAGLLLHVAFAPHRSGGEGHHEHGCSGHDHAHAAHDHDHDHHDHDHDHDHGHHDHGHHDHGHHDHGHHDHHHPHHAHGDGKGHAWAALGSVLGGGSIVGVSLFGGGALDKNISSFLETLGVLVLESAPALLLGYALAGIVPFLLTPARASALGRGGKLMQSLRGVAFGLPLPVCSCGVLPLYESLVRRGAPPVAAMAFFVATPELGLDAVLLSVPLLGTSLTVARVVTAFAVAVLVSLLVGRRSTVSCEPDMDDSPVSNDEPWALRVRSGLRFGFVEVFDHTMPWIALGLIIAALAEPMLEHDVIGTISPVLQVPLAALFGVPVYVCASGATPVAALAIHKGLSTGAAMAFLIAGPATNVTTFGVLARLHDRRTALLFGVTVTALAIVAGWTVDALGIPAAPVLEAHTDVGAHGSWFGWLCVVGLVLLTLASLVRQGPRGALLQVLEPIHTH